MWPLPTIGLNRSVTQHNVQCDALADWVEALVTFCTESVSVADLVDQLLAEYVYDDDDFCAQGVEAVWAELRARERAMGSGSLVLVEGKRVARRQAWDNAPANAFCLFLSLSRVFAGWGKRLGPDYVDQGALFEGVAGAACVSLLPRWSAHRTGWSRDHATKLGAVLHEVSDRLGLSSMPMEPWVTERANEAGVDLVLHREFADRRSASPIFLMQCASGQNWVEKRRDPDLRIWKKIVSFVNDPVRSLAIPFALMETEFLETGNIVNGLVLDRVRIISAGSETGEVWTPDELVSDLGKWLNARLGMLETPTG